MKKKQRVVENINQDYISTLPNSILGNILSSLKIKEALKTSVLSSKWRYLYKNPTNLILNEDNILVKDYSPTNINDLSKVLQFDIKMKRASTFLTNVNQYLSLVKDVQKIDKLKICFTFCHKGYGSNDLDKWIRFAVERNVEEIDLCLLEKNQLSAPSDGSFYVFPFDVFGFKSFLKSLRLSHCVLAPHKSCKLAFSTLTTMELLKVDLKSEKHVHNLLSSCDNIEWLSFSECYNVDYLKIEHPFCKKLKYLKVNLCQQLKAIILQSNNLETLEYEGCKIDFFFDTPKLRSFYGRVSKSATTYGESWTPLVKLSNDLPQLESLFLECICTELWQNNFSGFSPLNYDFLHPQDLILRAYLKDMSPVSPINGEIIRKKFPPFPNLRHLEVIKVAVSRQDLSWIPITLKACPALSSLKLHLRTSFQIEEELWKTSGPSRYQHDHLKEVTITGIKGHSSEIAIAIYLLKNAIALKKMVVDPRPRIYLGNGKCGHLEEASENWSKVEREKVCMLLKKEVGSLVDLLIL